MSRQPAPAAVTIVASLCCPPSTLIYTSSLCFSWPHNFSTNGEYTHQPTSMSLWFRTVDKNTLRYAQWASATAELTYTAKFSSSTISSAIYHLQFYVACWSKGRWRLIHDAVLQGRIIEARRMGKGRLMTTKSTSHNCQHGHLYPY
jgi:hypothetical protein